MRLKDFVCIWFDPTRCEQKLVEFATRGDSLARYIIVDRLWLSNLSDQKTEVELLKLCADDDNPALLVSLTRVLARKGSLFFSDSLEIIKKILRKSNYYSSSEIGYNLEELCKSDLDTCLATLEKWMSSEQDPVAKFRMAELSKKLQTSRA